MCHMAQLKKQIESRGKSAQACRHGDVKGQHGEEVRASSQLLFQEFLVLGT